jgi:hypothetical protein
MASDQFLHQAPGRQNPAGAWLLVAAGTPGILLAYWSDEETALVRKFLIDLTFSIVISFGLWEFGLARRIWPEHPYLAISLLTAVSCAAFQIVLRDKAKSSGQ